MHYKKRTLIHLFLLLSSRQRTKGHLFDKINNENLRRLERESRDRISSDNSLLMLEKTSDSARAKTTEITQAIRRQRGFARDAVCRKLF